MLWTSTPLPMNPVLVDWPGASTRFAVSTLYPGVEALAILLLVTSSACWNARSPETLVESRSAFRYRLYSVPLPEVVGRLAANLSDPDGPDPAAAAAGATALANRCVRARVRVPATAVSLLA